MMAVNIAVMLLDQTVCLEMLFYKKAQILMEMNVLDSSSLKHLPLMIVNVRFAPSLKFTLFCLLGPFPGKHLDMYNKGHPYSGYPGYIMMTNMNNDSYMNNGSLSPPMPRTVSLVTLYLHQSITSTSLSS